MAASQRPGPRPGRFLLGRFVTRRAFRLTRPSSTPDPSPAPPAKRRGEERALVSASIGWTAATADPGS
jgi:hypothetical protein